MNGYFDEFGEWIHPGDENYDPFSYEANNQFADPGGNSALRAGARLYPCPTCGEPNRLSSTDVRLGYQCDECADRAEGGGY